MAETIRIEIPIEAIDNTDPELSNITKGFQKLEDAADNANSAVKKADSSVSSFDSTAQKTQKSLASWAKEKYQVLLEAKDKISPYLTKIGTSLSSFAGKTYNITMKAIDLVTAPVKAIINLLKNPILQVGAVLGVTVSLQDTIETYTNFEAAMSEVSAISGSTGDELDKLTAKAKEMGSTTKFTAEESAEAFNYMAMAGWDTADMLDGIEGVLSLAAASGEDLATTSDIVTDALTAFGMQASDAGHFSDVLAAAASSANTTVSGMGETFKYAGTMAGTLGYSIEDVALATGLMANAGVKGTMAGTALNSIFTRLSTNTGNATDALNDLGIEFYDSAGNARDLSDVMDELRDATADMNDEQKANLANTIAGTQAQKGLLAILNATEDDYNSLTEAINNADGAAADMAETMLDNLSGSITLLQSAWDSVKLTAGERIAPYIRGIADYLTDAMPTIQGYISDFMDWFDKKMSNVQQRFTEITGSIDFQNADIFGKAKLLWDGIIAEPFMEWWNSTGKAKIADIAGNIGNVIGTGLKTGLLALLGIDLSSSSDEGTSVGAAFAKGFQEGFDFEAIAKQFLKALKNVFSSALELLPGGDSASLSSLFSAYLAMKMISPLISLGQAGVSTGQLLKTVFGGAATGGLGLGSAIIGSTGNAMVSGSGILGGLASLGYASGVGSKAGLYFGTSAGAMSGGTAALLGAGGVAGVVAGGVSTASGLIDAYKAAKSDDKAETKAYGTSAGLKLGGVAAGALIGTAVFPGIGTAIGAGIGGIVGMVAGNKVKSNYQETAEELQLIADKTQAVYEATGKTISDTAVFANEALSDALNDSEVDAEEFARMFQESCADVMADAFGDISLSLEEIQELAGNIVFDDQAESATEFATAVDEAASSLSTLESTMQNLKKLNWKASLGFTLSEDDIDEYKSEIAALIEEAEDYLTDRQYEATLAINLLVGEENSEGFTSGLNSVYESLQSQLSDASTELSRVMDEVLADGVVSTTDMVTVTIGGVEYDLNEAEAVAELQSQIAEITEKVSSAETEATFESLKIRYSGSELDAESFASLQAELQTEVESLTSNYDESLFLSLKSLNLELQEGAIDQSEYDALKQELQDAYDANIEELQVRVESFQLDTIADSYSESLENILPDIEGTTTEKLTEAMNNALAIEPDPAEWTTDDIVSWFGLEGLSEEVQTNVSALLQSTAESIPTSLKDSIIESVGTLDYSELDFVGPFSQEVYDQLAALDFSDADMTALKDSLSNGVVTAIEDADMEKVTEAIDILKVDVATSFDTVFGAGISTSMPVDVTLDYNVLNPTKTFTVSGTGNTTGSSTITVKANAAGGYVSGGPVLSWLAEEGYGEFVIPTSPSRRARALDLYEQAGEALGVTANAAGGYVSGSNSALGSADYNLFTEVAQNEAYAYNESTGEEDETVPVTEGNGNGSTIQVSVQMSPEFTIQGSDSQSEDEIMAVIRKNMKAMADELGGEIAERLETVFSNMPKRKAV